MTLPAIFAILVGAGMIAQWVWIFIFGVLLTLGIASAVSIAGRLAG